MQRPEESKQLSAANVAMKLGFMLQLLAFLISMLSFFSPFWYIELNTLITAGLWGRCDAYQQNCIWFNERNYAWERSLPGWHVAAQVTFAIGIGTLGISWFLAIGYLMFRCCKSTYPGTMPIIFALLVLVAMIFETISIIIFGVGAYNNYECSLNSWVAHFEWAFYVGIAALFNLLITALAYLFAGYAIREDMKGYDYAMSM